MAADEEVELAVVEGQFGDVGSHVGVRILEVHGHDLREAGAQPRRQERLRGEVEDAHARSREELLVEEEHPQQPVPRT